MSKTSAVLERMKLAGIPYISVITDPTYGGVSASLAMLGDVNIAEPGALIGFAGPRVIEYLDQIDLPAQMAAALCVLMSFVIPLSMVNFFLIGSLLVPQGILFARSVERSENNRPVKPYLVVNEALVLVIVVGGFVLRG